MLLIVSRIGKASWEHMEQFKKTTKTMEKELKENCISYICDSLC